MAFDARRAPHFVQGKEDDDDDTEQDFSQSPDQSDDSDDDPTFTETLSGLSRLSVEKKKTTSSRVVKSGTQSKSRRLVFDLGEVDDLDVPDDLREADQKSFDCVQCLIKDGKLEKLKIDQCKVYLRKYGLRLTGNKDTLIQRINEHIRILNGGGERDYPPSSFVLNCKGDACMGDVVMFEQRVYDAFDLASRRGPPIGTRVIAGRIVKESYGAAKQQHTFTIEVLWSRGEKPLPPLHPLLIKGRNLYRMKTLRQRWEDETLREKALKDKHSRGEAARSDREMRILEKEMKKELREKRVPRMNKDPLSEHPPIRLPPQQLMDHVHPHSVRGQGPAHRGFENMNHRLHQIGPSQTVHHQQQQQKHHSDRGIVGTLRSDHGMGRHTQTSARSWENVECQPTSPRRGNYQHPARQRCWYFAEGRCHFGSNCKFSHDKLPIQSP